MILHDHRHSDNSPPSDESTGAATHSLRPYQRDALAAVDAAARVGITRSLIVHPTGTGKTVIFTALILSRLDRGPALVLVHTDELVRQTIERLREGGYAGEVGIVKAGRDQYDTPVVIASVQTLSRANRLARIVPPGGHPRFATIVVDEAHHVTAAGYQRILVACGAFNADGPLVIGLTATPERADGAPLGATFAGIVHRLTILDMIEAGYLANLRGECVGFPLDLDRIGTRGGDFAEGALASAMLAIDAPGAVVKALAEHAPDRKSLVFLPSVALVQATAARLCDAGFAAAAITGETPHDERVRILADFHTGAIHVVCNCAVLTEGFDEPSINCIVIARPTLSPTLYQQMIGRGTRISPGKTDCLVLDLVGASSRHTLVTLASLTRHDADMLADGGIAAAAENDYLPMRNGYSGTLDGRLQARAVDLFGRTAYHWLQVDAAYILDAGEYLFAVEPEAGLYRVRCYVRGEKAAHLLAAQLPIDTAYAMVERHAATVPNVKKFSRASQWRGTVSTDKQNSALNRLGVNVNRALSKGEAANFITAVIYRIRRTQPTMKEVA